MVHVENVVPKAAVQRVAIGYPEERLIEGRAVERVVAVAAEQRVAAVGIERIGVADATLDEVVPRPADEQIAPARAVQRVVAAETVDGVVALGTDETIVARRTGNHFAAAGAAVDDFDVRGAKRRRAHQGGDRHPGRRAGSIFVVEKVPARRVIDEAVGRIVRGVGAGCREEPLVAWCEIARRADVVEPLPVEAELVERGGEVGYEMAAEHERVGT
jgi:hypothetical protein